MIDRVLTSGPTRSGGDEHEAIHTVTDVNTGVGAGVYDLDDRLQYGAGVRVRSADVVNASPGTVPVYGGWNGVSTVRGAGVAMEADNVVGPADEACAELDDELESHKRVDNTTAMREDIRTTGNRAKAVPCAGR